jgi:FAD:protein FMN transferase
MISSMRLWAFSVLLGLSACSEPPALRELQKIDGEAQGTGYHIVFWSEGPVDDLALTAKIQLVFEDIDRNLSNYRADSMVEKFNALQSTQGQVVPKSLVELVRVAQKISAASQGCFDLTVKPLSALWGFDKGALSIPTAEQMQLTMQSVGMDKLHVIDEQHLSKNPATLQIDDDAVAQGYSVGRISKLLEDEGIDNYMVGIGGEFKTHGHKPDGSSWSIALEKPLPNQHSLNRLVTMPKDVGMSVMTSGTYRRFFEQRGVRYSHIFDARKGTPVAHNLVAVSVMHEDPVLANAWATALLCLGQEQGMLLANQEKLNALFIRQQGSELLESRSQTLSGSMLLKIQ